MQELIAILDKIKGYFLVITGMLYISGLICWSFYSWENNLGHVDALQLQYLVAGIIPSFIILYFFWLFKYSKSHSEKISNWLEKNLFILRTIRIVLSLSVLFFVVNLFFKLKFFETFYGILSSISISFKNILIFLLLNIIIIFPPALLRVEDEMSNKKSKLIQVLNYFLSIGNLFMAAYLRFFRFLATPFIIVIAILMLFIYYEDLYPNMPQEIGGVKPKNAIIITEPSAFSIQDITKIFPDSTRLRVGQTDTLSVYFYNDGKFIFKIYKDIVTQKTQAKTFEISHSLIKSVKWLD